MQFEKFLVKVLLNLVMMHTVTNWRPPEGRGTLGCVS